MTAFEPSRGPRSTVTADYEFEHYDETIERHVGFRPVDLERDLGRLHAWLGSDHVKPYWDLDEPLLEFRETLRGKLADDHQTLYIGCLDHVPMSYFERYWAAEDALAGYYDADPADQGVHLLLGPPEYVGEGNAVALLRAMIAFMFRHPETDRIVGEPDADNRAVAAVGKQCGFERQRTFVFEEEEKTATLSFCRRERFEREIWPPTADERAARSAEVSGDD